MNTYDVNLNCGVYGVSNCSCKANTPYDAFEKVFSKNLHKRWQDSFLGAKVVVLDGSRREWNFEDKP